MGNPTSEEREREHAPLVSGKCDCVSIVYKREKHTLIHEYVFHCDLKSLKMHLFAYFSQSKRAIISRRTVLSGLDINYLLPCPIIYSDEFYHWSL